MVPVDVMVSKPQNITDLVTFANLGNCSFLDRKEGSPVQAIATYGCTSRHKGPKPILSIYLIYFGKRLLWNLTYCTDIISKEGVSKIAENIKQKTPKQIV